MNAELYEQTNWRIPFTRRLGFHFVIKILPSNQTLRFGPANATPVFTFVVFSLERLSIGIWAIHVNGEEKFSLIHFECLRLAEADYKK